jgi:predicted aldo/keto reductase-like oxidoreductase
MEIWQYGVGFGLEDWAREALKKIPEDKQPARCTACGNCEDKCPNKLEIRKRMKELQALA